MKLVKFLADVPQKYLAEFPFKLNEVLIFLGEIENMPRHCVVANKEGKIFWGYHTNNFVVLTEDEV